MAVPWGGDTARRRRCVAGIGSRDEDGSISSIHVDDVTLAQCESATLLAEARREPDA
jgi:hypothetical protein